MGVTTAFWMTQFNPSQTSSLHYTQKQSNTGRRLINMSQNYKHGMFRKMQE